MVTARNKATLKQCIKGGSLSRQPGYLIAFDYDIETIEALKRAVPHTHREWREQEKVWWVAQEYETVLNNIFPNFNALAHLQGSLF